MAENWYVVLLAVALIFGLVRCYRRIRFAPARREGRRYFLVNLGVLAAGVALTLGGIRGGFSRQTRPITLSNATLYTSSDRKANLILSNPFCLLRTLGNRSLSYTRFFSFRNARLALLSLSRSEARYDRARAAQHRDLRYSRASAARISACLNPEFIPTGLGLRCLPSTRRCAKGTVFRTLSRTGTSRSRRCLRFCSLHPFLTARRSFLMPQALAETKALPALLADEGYSHLVLQRIGPGIDGIRSLCRRWAGVQRYYSREDYGKGLRHGRFRRILGHLGTNRFYNI